MQVQKIRQLLRMKGLGEIRVGTVDDLQGQEERVIFISTVLSKEESLPMQVTSHGSEKGRENPEVGFWRNPRRFNVAITRAKALLVVVGHPNILVKVSMNNNDLYALFIMYFVFLISSYSSFIFFPLLFSAYLF